MIYLLLMPNESRSEILNSLILYRDNRGPSLRSGSKTLFFRRELRSNAFRSRPVLLAQLFLQHFAGPRAGQRSKKFHGARAFVVGKIAATKFQDLSLCRRNAGLHDD